MALRASGRLNVRMAKGGSIWKIVSGADKGRLQAHEDEFNHEGHEGHERFLLCFVFFASFVVE